MSCIWRVTVKSTYLWKVILREFRKTVGFFFSVFFHCSIVFRLNFTWKRLPCRPAAEACSVTHSRCSCCCMHWGAGGDLDTCGSLLAAWPSLNWTPTTLGVRPWSPSPQFGLSLPLMPFLWTTLSWSLRLMQLLQRPMQWRPFWCVCVRRLSPTAGLLCTSDTKGLLYASPLRGSPVCVSRYNVTPMCQLCLEEWTENWWTTMTHTLSLSLTHTQNLLRVLPMITHTLLTFFLEAHL